MFNEYDPEEKITVNRRDYDRNLEELQDLREMRRAVMDYFNKNAPELVTIFRANRR